MSELFNCDPDCAISDLGTSEWLVIVIAFVIVVTATIVLRKWAFEWNKIPETSLMWHFPRFIFISFIVLIITYPIVSFIFGSTAGYVYLKVISPAICIVVYVLWLLFLDTEPNEE